MMEQKGLHEQEIVMFGLCILSSSPRHYYNVVVS